MRNKLFIFFLLIGSLVAYGQEDEKPVKVDKSTPDFLLQKDSIFVSEKKKKKRKKKTFNKLKTKRGYTKRGAGRGLTIEQFYYLKKYKEPNSFISPIYLYDVSKLKLLRVKNYSKTKYPPNLFKVVHGPYIKKRGNVVLEEGYFWVGTLHDNWFKYKGEEQIVLERKSYHKGFPEKYEIVYYDPADKTKVKEINPIDGLERNSGIYKYYYNSGRIKTRGRLEKGKKVGKWYEYYSNGKKKKESTYTYKDNQEVEEILNEWKVDGKLLQKYIERDKKIQEEKKKNKPKMKF